MKESERDKAPLFYTPGSMSERAAGKLKKKKEERLKNVLGALSFPLSQIYLFHTASFSSFNQLLPPYPQTLSLSASISFSLPPPPLYLCLLSESSSEAQLSLRGTADLSVSINPPPAVSSFPVFSSQSCQISRESGGSSVFPVTCAL